MVDGYYEELELSIKWKVSDNKLIRVDDEDNELYFFSIDNFEFDELKSFGFSFIDFIMSNIYSLGVYIRKFRVKLYDSGLEINIPLKDRVKFHNKVLEKINEISSIKIIKENKPKRYEDRLLNLFDDEVSTLTENKKIIHNTLDSVKTNSIGYRSFSIGHQTRSKGLNSFSPSFMINDKKSGKNLTIDMSFEKIMKETLNKIKDTKNKVIEG